MSVFYSIRHLTCFRYATPVSESLMELRMHPRTEGGQRCLSFQLSVEPRTRVYEGVGSPQFNLVHGLTISKDGIVYVARMTNAPRIPQTSARCWAIGGTPK